MQFTLYHEWELVAKNWGTTLLLHKSFNSLSCIFCPSRFLQKRLLRRSWLESGHGWLAPRVAIGCHRFLVQPARFQRGRACSTIIVRAISTSRTDLHFHCENIFNVKLTLTQIDFMALLCSASMCKNGWNVIIGLNQCKCFQILLVLQWWFAKVTRLWSTKKFLHEKPIAVRHLQPSDQIFNLSKKEIEFNAKLNNICYRLASSLTSSSSQSKTQEIIFDCP